MFSLPCLICLSVCLLAHFSRSASSARRWASPAPSSSRACSAALLAARQTRRLLLALRMCGPLSARIHHALCPHDMCLFDTWHSSCTEVAFSCCPLGLHLALVPLLGFHFALVAHWASTSLSCSTSLATLTESFPCNMNSWPSSHSICRCDVCDGSQDDGRRTVFEQSVQRITSKETAQT